jgi:hypothetical protein
MLVRAALLAGCVLGGWHGAAAQSCSVPQTLVVNSVISIDTCQSTYMPSLLCGGIVSGPAAVFAVNIGYPGLLAFEVTPGVGSQFDPAIAVTGPQCETGNCPRLVDSGGQGQPEQVNLDIDSGSYRIIVTSFNPVAGTCGTALIHLYERTLGSGGNSDGIFRQGFEY